MWDLLTEAADIVLDSTIDLRLAAKSVWLDWKRFWRDPGPTMATLFDSLFWGQPMLVQIFTALLACLVVSGAMFYSYLKWTFRRCTSNRRLEGKTVLVTGANSGTNIIKHSQNEQYLPHLSKGISGFQQKCTQFPCTFFPALSHGLIHFVPGVSSKNIKVEVSDWLHS